MCMNEYVKLVNFMQIYISLSRTSLSDSNEHAYARTEEDDEEISKRIPVKEKYTGLK